MKYILSAFTMAAALASGTASATEIVVTQNDKEFSSESVDAAVGDTIVFRNDDKVAHNVHSTTAGHKFNLGLQKPGESAQLVLSEDGTIAIRCAIHPKMKITVNVK